MNSNSVILLVCFLALAASPFLLRRFSRARTDAYGAFAVGARNFGWFRIGAGLSATFVGGAAVLNLAGLGYVYGWYGLTDVLAVSGALAVSAVFVVPRLCRRPGISLGGFLQVSDRLVDITTGLLSTVVYTLVTAAQIVALIKVVQPFFPVPAPVLALAATLGIAAYVLYGGYASVTVTDVIQFLVMGVCYFGLVGLSLLAGAGGPGAGAPIPPQTMPLDLVLLLATPFLFIPVSQDLHIRVNSAASPGHARLGVAVAAAAYLVFGIVSVSVGRALAQAGIALGVPDDAVPAFLARTFGSFAIVPTVAIVCVVVSTLDSMLFASASSLAYDFWDKAASRSRQKDTARPRVATMIVLGLALAIALQAPRILALVLSALALYVSVLLPMMIGRLLDRRPSHLGRLALALFLFVLGAETALHAAVALGALPVLPPFRAFAYTLVHLLAVAALKREAAP